MSVRGITSYFGLFVLFETYLELIKSNSPQQRVTTVISNIQKKLFSAHTIGEGKL